MEILRNVQRVIHQSLNPNPMNPLRTNILLLAVLLASSLTSLGQEVKPNDYLTRFTDTLKDECGYKNQAGDTVIPLGKYAICFTDTFRTYAIVLKPNAGFVAIDRNEKTLYEVFPFDNGPDMPSEGLFRIVENAKIGFADSATGRVVIAPQFECAWPFEHGVAKVSMECTEQSDGEHKTWLSNSWYYIDKTGRRVNQLKEN